MAITRFRWNAAAGRYVDSAGRFVPASAVRNALDFAIRQAEDRIDRLAGQLAVGAIAPHEWERQMREQIKAVHLYSAMAARGGRAQMTAAGFGQVGAEVRQQYAWLARFRQQIEDGLPLDGQFYQRVGLYVEAGRGTFHRAEGQVAADRGATEEHNILHPADHCDECLAQSGRGWVPIGTLVPIGRRQCQARCRCSLAYR